MAPDVAPAPSRGRFAEQITEHRHRLHFVGGSLVMRQRCLLLTAAQFLAVMVGYEVTMRCREELLEEIAAMEARKARVDGLYHEWTRLSAVSRSAAGAMALTAWQPRKAQEAFAKYQGACKAADLVFANMMAEMGDRRFLDDIETEQGREQ